MTNNEFSTTLFRLRVRSKYMNNFRKEYGSEVTVSDIFGTDSELPFTDRISRLFMLRRIKEGKDFWAYIASKNK